KLPGLGWRIDLLQKRETQLKKLRAEVRVRDRKVAELQESVRKERASRKRAQERLAVDLPEVGDTTPPSFRRNLINLRRDVELLRTIDRDVYHPVLQIPRKLRNYPAGREPRDRRSGGAGGLGRPRGSRPV